MSGNNSRKGGDGFGEALAELVHGAVLNGTEIKGAWDIYGDDGDPEFTVEIYRLDE